MAQALPETDRVGLESISSALLNKVTHYHAQIGHNVDKSKLYELEYNLLQDAKNLYHSHHWEDALNTFAQVLAIVEKTRTSQDHATRGAIVHNIGSCLHNLGEFDAAQAYYEQAVESFRKASSPLVDRLFYGDINRRRIEFVKERLIDISWGRKPDEDKFLNEFGYKRDAPKPPDAAPADATLSRNWENEPPPPMQESDYIANPPRWMVGMDGPPGYASNYGSGYRGGAGAGGGGGYGGGGGSSYDDYEGDAGPAGGSGGMSEQERRELFQHCLQHADWDKAEQLARTQVRARRARARRRRRRRRVPPDSMTMTTL